MASQAEPKITFYDLASTAPGQAFSPSSWGIRFMLNYKKIPYRTVFVHFPDIPSTLEAAGLPPKSDTDSPYTIPSIVDASTEAPVRLADSAIIADYLEKTYPEPRLYSHALGSPGSEESAKEQRELERLVFGSLGGGLFGMGVEAQRSILDDRDWEFHVRTRKERLGSRWAELIASTTREESVAKLHEGLNGLSRAIDERATSLSGGEGGEGEAKWPFGRAKPVYADFVLCGMFIYMKLVLPDVWEQVKERDGGRWARLFRSCEPYTQTM